MFKLPDGIPNYRASAQDWADYAEYHALINGKINFYTLTKAPRIVSDESLVMGTEDTTDRYIQKTDEISAEIRYRMQIGGERYPFVLEDHDYSLSYSPQSEESTIIYPYMLLATRSNMSKDRIQAGIDGALLFEEVCSVAVQNYFGPRAAVDIIGTSRNERLSFRDKLRSITHALGEGGEIIENPGYKPQDGKVDVIVWKGFKDRQPSQMIAFGQCKTGTSWVDSISELNTEVFCKNWFTQQPVLTPVRMFFTAQDFPREIFRVRANSAGLVFDRLRILDYLPEEIDGDLLGRMETWTQAVRGYYSEA